MERRNRDPIQAAHASTYSVRVLYILTQCAYSQHSKSPVHDISMKSTTTLEKRPPARRTFPCRNKRTGDNYQFFLQRRSVVYSSCLHLTTPKAPVATSDKKITIKRSTLKELVLFWKFCRTSRKPYMYTLCLKIPDPHDFGGSAIYTYKNCCFWWVF